MTANHDHGFLDNLKAELLAEADAANAVYPQYRGHWDAWVVARARRDIRQRGELRLAKGEYCLLNPASLAKHPDGRFPEVTFVTVYLAGKPGNVLRHLDTSRRASDFEVLG